MVEQNKTTKEMAVEGLDNSSPHMAVQGKPGPFTYIKNWIKANYKGYLYTMPVILGILFFTLAPMAISLYYSFFDYNGLKPPENFGFQNYIRLFNGSVASKTFVKSLEVTLIYTVINLPLTMILSFFLAMFLNNNIKGIKVFRVLYYLPCVIPTVISGLLWQNFTDTEYGLGPQWLAAMGLPDWQFFRGENSAMPTLIFLSLFGLGGGMILWLAQLKQISQEMYESAEIEGAGWFTKTFRITIPMCTPMIFYNLIMGIIGSFQTFGNVFTLTNGSAGTNNSLLFYVMNVYNEAFTSFRMGRACALSWILFIIIGLLTVLVFKTSRWVFYSEEV